MLDLFSSGVLSVVSFLLVITVIIVIHELGHYGAGRFFGVHAETFSIGMGQTLWSRTDRSGTVWRVAAMPLGGYVKFRGDLNAASAPDRETLQRLRLEHEAADTVFHFKPVWQRAIIILAGPFANFVLAAVLFAGLGLAEGEQRYEPRIGVVHAETPAEDAGLQSGDVIRALDGARVDDFLQLPAMIAARDGETLEIDFERGGALMSAEITPRRLMGADGELRRFASLGVSLDRDVQPEQVCCSILQAPGYGVERTAELISLNAGFFWGLITLQNSMADVSGPLGIATLTGQVANNAARAPAATPVEVGDAPAPRVSILAVVASVVVAMAALAAFLSVAIGFINLLPIPVLDGGHLMYYAYEAISGRAPSVMVQEIAFRGGFLLLISVLVVATWNDLSYLRGLFS